MDRNLGLSWTEAAQMGAQHRGQPMKVFDWNRAAVLLVRYSVQNAWAGLAEDWDSTSGPILTVGKICEPAGDSTYYFSSTWAVPMLLIDGEVGIDCFTDLKLYPSWQGNVFWPGEAVGNLSRLRAMEKVCHYTTEGRALLKSWRLGGADDANVFADWLIDNELPHVANLIRKYA